MSWRWRGAGRRCAGVLLAMLAIQIADASAQEAPVTPLLAATQRIPIRDVADGSGPSNLIAIGRYLLVVDPWAAEIRRYDAAAPERDAVACRIPRTFAPWHSDRHGQSVRLISEPYGPIAASGYSLRPRQQMMIAAPAVAAMQAGAPCPFAIRPYDRRLTPAARMRWTHKAQRGAPVLLHTSRGLRARIEPQAGRQSEIFAAREIGRISGGRTLVWWSEVDSFPQRGAPAPAGGRMTASQYVGIIPRGGRRPQTIIRLESAIAPPLLPDGAFPESSLLLKPGFEYAVGSSLGGVDRLWLMVANEFSSGPRQFVLFGYDLAALRPGEPATIALVHGEAPSIDRQDAVHADEETALAAPVYPDVPRATWFAAARRLIQEQISFTWTFPQGAVERPCGGADRCRVGANAAGVLGTGPDFPNPVTDRINVDGGANWMRPRHLVGLAPGAVVRGIPYSIGGTDLTDSFAARLHQGYPAAAATAPPIGHIREGMEWSNSAGNYPLGIDCSALIAKIYGIGMRSTGNMMKPTLYQGADGRRYRIPRGPDRGCPQPIRHLSEMRPGDIFLREGHVVIFAGITQLGGAMGGSRALRVLESSARCGGVCESVYDPTYFDGWWMLRIRTSTGGQECPGWLDGETLAPREERIPIRKDAVASHGPQS